MTESIPYMDGDWFQHEDGLYYEFQFDIDNNVMRWCEIYKPLNDNRKVDPPEKELILTVYIASNKAWVPVRRVYGIDGIDNLNTGPKNL